MPRSRGKKRKLKDSKANSCPSDGKALRRFQSTVKSVSDGKNCNITKQTDESQKFEVEGTDPFSMKDGLHELLQIQTLSLDINDVTDGEQVHENNLITDKVSNINTGLAVKYESHTSLSNMTQDPVVKKNVLCGNLLCAIQNKAKMPETAQLKETETIVQLCEIQSSVSKSNEEFCYEKDSQENKYQSPILQEMRKDEVITDDGLENKFENIKKGLMNTALTKGSKIVGKETVSKIADNDTKHTTEVRSSPDPLQDTQGTRSITYDEHIKGEAVCNDAGSSTSLTTELRSSPDPFQKVKHLSTKSAIYEEQNKAETIHKDTDFNTSSTTELRCSPDSLLDKRTSTRSAAYDEQSKAETICKDVDSNIISLITEVRSSPHTLQVKHSSTKSATYDEQNKAEAKFVSASQTSLLMSSKDSHGLDFPVSQRQIKKKFEPPVKGRHTANEENSEITDLFLLSQSLPANDVLSVERQSVHLSLNDAKMQILADSGPAPNMPSVPETGANAYAPVPVNKTQKISNKSELENPVQDMKDNKDDDTEHQTLKGIGSKLQYKSSMEIFKDAKIFDRGEVRALNPAKEQSDANKISDVVKEIDQCQGEQSFTGSKPDNAKNNHNIEHSIDHLGIDLNEAGLATSVNSVYTLQTLDQKSTTKEGTNDGTCVTFESGATSVNSVYTLQTLDQKCATKEGRPTNDGTCVTFESGAYFRNAFQLKEPRSHGDEKDSRFTEETKEANVDTIVDSMSVNVNQPYAACSEEKKEFIQGKSFASCSEEFTPSFSTAHIKSASAEREGFVHYGTEIYSINADALDFDMGRSVDDANQNMVSKDKETKITLSADGFANNSKDQEEEINGGVNGHATDSNNTTVANSDTNSNMRIQDSPDGTQPFCSVTFSPQLNTTLSSQELSQDKPSISLGSINVTDRPNVPSESNSNVLKQCNNGSGFAWQESKNYPTALSNSNISIISKNHNDAYNGIDTDLSHEFKTAQQNSHSNNITSEIHHSYDGLSETSRAPECMTPLAKETKTTPAEGELTKPNKIMSPRRIDGRDNISDVLKHCEDIPNVSLDEQCRNTNKCVSPYSSLPGETGKNNNKTEQLNSYNSFANISSLPEKKNLPVEQMSKKSGVVFHREAHCSNIPRNCPILENTYFSSGGSLKQPDFTGGGSLSYNRHLSISKLNQDSNVTKFIPLQEHTDSCNLNANNFALTRTYTSETKENKTSCNSLIADVKTDQIMITEDFQDTSCALDNQSFLETSIDVSDSQLCKLANEDFFENDFDSGQMKEIGNPEDEFQCGLAAAETKTLKELEKKKSEGKQLLHTIMADLVSINKQLLGMKREMDMARKKFTQQQKSRFPSKNKSGFNFGAGT